MSNGYTGRLFEEEVLGHCGGSWSGYMTYHQSLDFVKNNQIWDPTDPSSRTANDLHSHVALELGLEDWSELKFYSALKTPLDLFHGVDGFFEFRGTVVTIDVTININKQKYKADLIFHPSDDLEILAYQVASQLKGGRI